MPPLKSAEYVTTPLNPEEAALRTEVKALSDDIWIRSNRIVPYKRMSLRTAYSQCKPMDTPKASYRLDDQPSNELTRAWLSRTPEYKEIYIWTDRVLLSGENDSVVTPIPDSRHKHAWMNEHHVVPHGGYSLTDRQILEFLNDANETLQLIEDVNRQTQLALGEQATTKHIIGWQN